MKKKDIEKMKQYGIVFVIALIAIFVSQTEWFENMMTKVKNMFGGM